MLMAKIQDEVGHAHVTARVAEDLGVTREQIITDYLEGRTKLLNVFHYGFDTWEEIGPAALLMNSGAIVQFQALDREHPALRACPAEDREGRKLPLPPRARHDSPDDGVRDRRTASSGAAGFRNLVPAHSRLPRAPADPNFEDNPMYKFGLKVEPNDVLRQAWLTKIIPIFVQLSVHVDPELVRFDAETDQWVYAPPDWAEIKRVLIEGGPRAGQWRAMIARSMERNVSYRERGGQLREGRNRSGRVRGIHSVRRQAQCPDRVGRKRPRQ